MLGSTFKPSDGGNSTTTGHHIPRIRKYGWQRSVFLLEISNLMMLLLVKNPRLSKTVLQYDMYLLLVCLVLATWPCLSGLGDSNVFLVDALP